MSDPGSYPWTDATLAARYLAPEAKVYIAYAGDDQYELHGARCDEEPMFLRFKTRASCAEMLLQLMSRCDVVVDLALFKPQREDFDCLDQAWNRGAVQKLSTTRTRSLKYDDVMDQLLILRDARTY